MKLSDIDEKLNEAPVGALTRAATTLKKYNPFSAGGRAEAAGEEKTQKAANELAKAFRFWLGASGIKDKQKIPHDKLLKFFFGENMGDTAEEVIGNHPKVKAAEQGKEAVDDDPGSEVGQTTLQKPENMSDEEFANIKKQYGFESLQARLDKMLNEAEVDMTDPKKPQVFFDLKEVEELILTIVGEIHEENPDGLDRWLERKGADTGSDEGEEGEAEADPDDPSVQVINQLKSTMTKAGLKNEKAQDALVGDIARILQKNKDVLFKDD